MCVCVCVCVCGFVCYTYSDISPYAVLTSAIGPYLAFVQITVQMPYLSNNQSILPTYQTFSPYVVLTSQLIHTLYFPAFDSILSTYPVVSPYVHHYSRTQRAGRIHTSSSILKLKVKCVVVKSESY